MSLVCQALPTVPERGRARETVNDQAAAYGVDWEVIECARLKDVSELTVLVEHLKQAIARMLDGE